MFMPGARFLPGFSRDQDDAVDRRKEAAEKQQAAMEKAADKAFGGDFVDALVDVGVSMISIGVLATVASFGPFGFTAATAAIHALARKHGIDPDDFGSPGDTARPVTILTDDGASITARVDPDNSFEIAGTEVSDPPESDTFDFAAMRSEPNPDPNTPPTDDPSLPFDGSQDSDTEALPDDNVDGDAETGSPHDGTLFDVDEFALV